MTNKIMKRLLCLFGLHKYEVLREEDVKCFDEVVGKAIINRCDCCGKIKITKFTTIVSGDNVQYYYRKQ